MRLSPLDRIPSDRAVLDAFAWEHRDRCGTDTRNAETTPGEGSVNAGEVGEPKRQVEASEPLPQKAPEPVTSPEPDKEAERVDS